MEMECIRWKFESKNGSESVDFVDITLDDDEGPWQMSHDRFVALFGVTLPARVHRTFVLETPMTIRPS